MAVAVEVEALLARRATASASAGLTLTPVSIAACSWPSTAARMALTLASRCRLAAKSSPSSSTCDG